MNSHKFELEKSYSGQMCFEGKKLPLLVLRMVRKIMRNQYSDTEDYKQKQAAHPFLQGYDENSGWILVEFWTSNEDACKRFIEHVNKQLSRTVVIDGDHCSIELHAQRDLKGRMICMAQDDGFDFILLARNYPFGKVVSSVPVKILGDMPVFRDAYTATNWIQENAEQIKATPITYRS